MEEDAAVMGRTLPAQIKRLLELAQAVNYRQEDARGKGLLGLSEA